MPPKKGKKGGATPKGKKPSLAAGMAAALDEPEAQEEKKADQEEMPPVPTPPADETDRSERTELDVEEESKGEVQDCDDDSSEEEIPQLKEEVVGNNEEPASVDKAL